MELFGRETELDRIARFLESVRHSGDVRLVRGEPGVGKSALIAAAADLAAEAGLRVLRASGSEFEADVSYSMLNQLLLPLHDEMLRLPPGPRDALNVALGFGPGPSAPPLLVCNAALALVVTVAQKAPVLLVVDDVQWIDRPSAVVLGFVARRVAGSPVGVVATSRTGTGSFLDPRGLTEVALQPLSPEASGQLVDARFPGLPSDMRRQLLELAQGNPLALTELPATLVSPASQGPARRDVVPLSEHLQTLFAQRISGLPEATRKLLLLATFEGSGDLRILREAADIADLAPAEQERLVRVDGVTAHLTFRHPLIRSALVALSTHDERRDAHLAIAAALADDLERRAWHLAAAMSGPDDTVATQLDEAAHRVRMRGDMLGAVAALVRAAELSATTEARARRLAEAAYIGAESGDTGTDAVTLLADARATALDPSGSLNAANATAFLMLNGDGDVHTAHRLLAGAIETGGHGWRSDDPALVEALHTLVLLSWYAGRPEHWAVFHRAMARLTPCPTDILSVLSKTFPDPVRTGAAALDEIDGLLAELARTDDAARIIRTGTASVYLDRLADNREPSWRLVHQGRQGGSPRRHLGALMHLCLDDYLTGRWDEAEELAREGQQLCDTAGVQFFAWYFRYNRAIIAAGRGRPEEANGLADEITHWALPRGVAGAALFAHHPRTLAASAEGDFEAAYQNAVAMSPAGELARYAPHCTWVMFDLVEAAMRTGRTAEARAHAEAMRSAGVARLSPRMALVQRGADALAFDDDETNRRLEATLREPAAQHWLFEASRIRLAFAEKLRRRKALTAARSHLLDAHQGFASMGATPWLTRTAQELRVTGLRPETIEDAVPTTLTAQELEIAQLAASGLSNKQIAERLFLSHRTVGAHLYRVFPKLGISSRAGLRDALSRGSRSS
ncbi:ATP-binding protein [Paractinoplanes hotanensis]|uniref:AAA family ATPase n=1 Tax=Paractinoplanes hotanensis TaxID=2906497 RepID=A0ABT0YE46_9ACTN|nr:AAA family ATPase [Actinoplanes hotanensis]MCM4084314.1 AAA family ATPase [Actinoplanes hotanensis]